MDIRAALTSDLEKEFRAEALRAERAVTRAVRGAGNGLKNELRQQTRQAGLGRKLPNTWRSDFYPKSGESLGAAATIYSKAKKIMMVFEEGATIRAKDGRFLAIPTENAPAQGVGSNKRISPTNWPDHVYGPLRFVYRRRGPSLLVVDNLRARKGKRRDQVRRRGAGFGKASATALRTGKGLTTVVMFILVPQVRVKKRIDAEFSFRKWSDRVPTLISIEFRKLDAQAGGR